MKLKILRVSIVLKILKISRSSLYNKLNPKSKYFDESFPKKVWLGSSTIGDMKFIHDFFLKGSNYGYN